VLGIVGKRHQMVKRLDSRSKGTKSSRSKKLVEKQNEFDPAKSCHPQYYDKSFVNDLHKNTPFYTSTSTIAQLIQDPRAWEAGLMNEEMKTKYEREMIRQVLEEKEQDELVKKSYTGEYLNYDHFSHYVIRQAGVSQATPYPSFASKLGNTTNDGSLLWQNAGKIKRDSIFKRILTFANNVLRKERARKAPQSTPVISSTPEETKQ
jgi:hypothetical protein